MDGQTSETMAMRAVRRTMVAAGLLFLVNIFLGFGNILAAPTLPRAQLLTHLHAGTIGWITLGVISVAMWAFRGGSTTTPSYAKAVNMVSWFGITAFAGYIGSFALAFSQGGAWFRLMPVFGSASALTIIGSFVFFAREARRQDVLTAGHLFFLGGLGVASLGATMGVLLGLQHALQTTFIPGNNIGTHAGVMDTYLFQAGAALVSVVLAFGSTPKRWNKSALAAVILWVASAILIWAALLTGTEAMLAPPSLLCLLAGTVVYLVRGGWRTFRTAGSAPHAFWGGLWLPSYAVVFVLIVAVYFIPGVPPPHWFLILFVHILFVGTATNLLVGASRVIAPAVPAALATLETIAVWTLNLGFIAFIAIEYALQRADGAWIMGLGVLGAVAAMLVRLTLHHDGPTPAVQMAATRAP